MTATKQHKKATKSSFDIQQHLGRAHTRMSNDKHEDGENLLEEELEDAKRYFALKNWSQAADAYGQVLESL